MRAVPGKLSTYYLERLVTVSQGRQFCVCRERIGDTRIAVSSTESMWPHLADLDTFLHMSNVLLTFLYCP